jgi:hypothetical protein
MWDDDGENVLEHLAGVEDFDLAMATYRVKPPDSSHYNSTAMKID